MIFELNDKSTGGYGYHSNFGKLHQYQARFFFYLQDCINVLNNFYPLSEILKKEIGNWGVSWYLSEYNETEQTAVFTLFTGYSKWTKYVFDVTVTSGKYTPIISMTMRKTETP